MPACVRRQRTPIVVKASGLAAGKGVVIAETRAAGDRSRREAMFAGQFGAAGHEVVIEEFLPGEEASFIVMADGTHVLPLATSQDHKRLDDGDRGPNTGGMGAYSPAPVVTPAVHARIMREVIEPTIRGLAADGTPYTGFLYAGLMIAPDGTPNVLEYNCRFGDPETQPIMMRLQSDLTSLCEAALDGRLDTMQATVGRARGARRGDGRSAAIRMRCARATSIEGLERAAALPGKVFHAGTRLEAGRIAHQRRTRAVRGRPGRRTSAQRKRQAYALVESIHWNGVQYRRDIGYRAIEREVMQRGPTRATP